MLHRLAYLVPFVAAALFFATACSGGDDDSASDQPQIENSGEPTAVLTVQNQPGLVQPLDATSNQPQDGVLEIVTENSAFIGNNVAVAVGEDVTIRVTNRDQLTHNLRLAGLDGQYDTEDDAVTEPDSIINGATGDLDFAPAIPGAYTFRCDFHPGSMGGQILVQ
jgi:plastocyanin